MDIGGGSTEFIICNENGLIWKKSYNIGAARLTQAYFKTDPISEENQAAIIAHLDKELADLKAACSKYKPQVLVGSAGAFETFALLLNEDLDLQNTISAELDPEAYKQLAGRLIRSTHEERKNIKGLIPLRVDMIVIASILTNYVIKELDLNSLHLSTYDLKMGVLYSL
jgi:exopolyphosphatase/guanosine-5'-triphosphate,3'-diphosphate pyrophosphatase